MFKSLQVGGCLVLVVGLLSGRVGNGSGSTGVSDGVILAGSVSSRTDGGVVAGFLI